MSDTKLGKLIEGDANRDAIHIAIAPVIAGQRLKPGEDIGLDGNGLAVRSDNPIGIVDPFLTDFVGKGDKFWLCLYQQTVTGMRHCWSHPSFVDEPTINPMVRSEKSASEQWIMEYAKELNVGYNDLMDSAALWIERGEYMTRGGVLEGHCTSDEFWKHYAAITGKTGEGSFFSCSC